MIHLGGCSKDSCFLFNTYKETFHSEHPCSNPFKGQRIGLSVFYASRPRVLNYGSSDKGVSGYGLNIFSMMARDLDFRPFVSFTDTSEYVPENRTFVGGKFGEVEFATSNHCGFVSCI